MEKNSILDSVLDIVDAELRADFKECYEYARCMFDTRFADCMAKIAVDIKQVQDLMENASPIDAVLLIESTPVDVYNIPDDSREFEKMANKFLRAAAVWMMLNGR